LVEDKLSPERHRKYLKAKKAISAKTSAKQRRSDISFCHCCQLLTAYFFTVKNIFRLTKVMQTLASPSFSLHRLNKIFKFYCCRCSIFAAVAPIGTQSAKSNTQLFF
jgi:hypothetical protein